MNWSDIGIVFRKELLQTTRNKKTLVVMVLILIMQPLIVALAAKVLENRITNRMPPPFTLIIVGADAEWVAKWFTDSKVIHTDVRPDGKLQTILEQAVAKGSDKIVLSVPAKFREQVETHAAKVPELDIYADNRQDNGRQMRLVNERLVRARRELSEVIMKKTDVPEVLHRQLDVRLATVASNQQRAGALIGVYLPIALVMMVMTVTLYASTDLLTGKRERGTLVLLMVSPVARRDILIGKMLVVVGLAAFASALLILLNVVFLHFTVHKAIDTAGFFDFRIPWRSAFLSILLVMPLVLSSSSISMAVASYARNYQQAQSYYTLLLLLALLPASAQLLPTIEYPPAIAIFPIANISICVRDLFTGQLQPGLLIATVVSSCLYAAGLTYVALRLFDSEHSVFPQDEPAGSARGFRRLTLTYLSCVFLFYFTVGQAIQAQDVLVGIIVSQFLLIAGPNFLYALWMKLPVKEFLGFKKPLNWRSLVAAPFLAPATIAASSALMAVQDLFLPSPKALEEMMISLIIPPGKPIWLVFAAIAVTPAICEEILFRGAVQRSLLKSLTPRVALILTAVAFGLFHMSTFRFLPTTLLGLAFGYYSWRQNSIYPTIILHGCHNALATAMVVYHLNIMSAQGLLVLAASSAVAIFILRSNQRQSVQA